MHFCFTKPSVVYDQDKCVLKFDSAVLLGVFVAFKDKAGVLIALT